MPRIPRTAKWRPPETPTDRARRRAALFFPDRRAGTDGLVEYLLEHDEENDPRYADGQPPEVLEARALHEERLARVIERCGIAWANPVILRCRFRIDFDIFASRVTAGFHEAMEIRIERPMNPSGVAEALRREGRRPAMLEELLLYATWRRSVILRTSASLVALGTAYEDEDGKVTVPCLSRDGERRRLGMQVEGAGDWPAKTHFLGILHRF